MNKIFAKALFFLIPLMFSFLSVAAQIITIGSVDPGPYGIGSTIAVPFTVNDASGCINTNNVYSLYLCDAAGNPIPGAPVDTINNFYGTSFNFKVPAGTAAGTYTYVIKSSSPVVSSLQSNPFVISASAGGTAAATCPSTEIGNTTYPNTFGTCSGTNGMVYTFTNASSGGSTTTATFFNETTQTTEATNVSLSPSYNFTASAANYLVTVRSVNASGVVSTYSYQLINNVVNTNFGTIGVAQACLVNGQAQLTYTIDYTSINGIQHNYPGNFYTISWGDGTPNSVYTLCQIEALNGLITHTYTKSSCGYTAGTNTDAFPVNYYTTNQYCGKIGTVVSDDAQIYNVPINEFTGPKIACTNTPVSFINTSTPQPCNNTSSARYNWLVDGVVVGTNYPLTENFVTTLPEGSHVITLHLLTQISGAGCMATDFTQTICVQNPPQPGFTIAPSHICLGSGPVTAVNTSVVDTTCNKTLTYAWSVTPSAGVTFNAASAQPNFTFTATGLYKISLSITTPSCGTVKAPMVDTIIVDATPVAKLSPDFAVCGTNQTLKFDSLTTSKTYTILTGTTTPQANTYAWTVTGGAYTYAPGYSSSSKYPHIIFTDYATYTITVTQQNNCGLVTSAPQHITFQQSPTVIAGNDTSICAGTSANLHGKITGTGVLSYKWVGGAGTYAPSVDSLNTTYTPSAAEVTAGHVTLSLQATTSDAAPCNLVTSSVILTITPIGNVTSPLTKTLCSDQRLNYQITSNNAGSTFTWTAKLISGSATGFSPSGTTSIITDSLVNTDPTATTNAVIAYTITPISVNGCPGTPATLNVTVTPLPIITATVTNAIICSKQPANITLTSKLGGTKYTWTSVASVGVTGNTNQSSAVSTTAIQDLLVNNGTSPANVTYTITPYSVSGCQGSPVIAVVTVDPIPVTAVAGRDTALCGASSYTLNGNSPAYGSGKWTVTSGSGVTFSNDTTANPTVSGLIPGNIYQFKWTITTGSGCASQSVVTITDNSQTVPGVTAATGPTTVCANGNSGQINLTGQVGKIIMWQQSVDNGATWQTVTPLDSLTTLLYKNLTTTTQYKAIVQNDACSIMASAITTITVNQPAPPANAGKDTTLCAATSYNLQGNNPGSNAGVWRLISGPSVTFADSTSYTTTVSNLQGGNVYLFSWTIKGATPCASSQAEVTVTDNAQTMPGITATTGPTTVCANGNSGQINLTGQLGKIVTWQQSVDNGATWQTVTPLDTIATLLYKNLTQTTEFQAIVQNNPCSTAASTITTITVNQPAPTANAGRDTILCGATTYTLMGNNPGSNAGVWHQTSGSPVTIADTSSYQTTISNLQGGNTYTFSWTIIGASPCANSQAQVSITDKADVIASFTNSATNSCGSQTVTFTNTSNNQAGASFLWNFGDGTTSTALNPQHVFKETTNGTDTTYIVSLSVLNNCDVRLPVYDTIHITSDKVIASILPLQTTGCAPFTLDVENTSPGTNVSYKFYLYNGNTLVQEIDKTDKTDAIFNPLNATSPTQYTLYMTATGPCGTSATTQNIPITVSPPTVIPQMYLLNGINSGCAPLTVTFVNNSSGGSSYHYNVYDANGNLIAQPVAGTANLPYLFTDPGTYSVSITAANNCSPQGIESAKIGITVYPVPQPAFTSSADCDATVTFTNTTAQNGTTPAGSLSYTWNFGDGSAPEYTFTPKPHVYNFKKSPFTVTLIATNTTSGCADSVTQTINVAAPLVAQFTEEPDSVVTIPNYEFSFIDQSTGPPSSWAWDFGDGTTSNSRNPIHRYSDTGYYQVRLVISNNGSCTSMVTHIVRVTGTPGQLFFPNAFMPTGSATELRIFMAKGSGMKTWLFQIFNHYGQLLWETNKLDSKGSPIEGWDGMYKGVLMPQGAYIWQASATFINGTVWKGMSYNGSETKRTGTVNLIR